MQNINTNQQFKIFSFYQFINLNNTKIIENSIFEFSSLKKIRGTTILSKEGINGTMAGTRDNMDEFLYLLKSLGFNQLNLKESYSFEMPFYRLKVKIKKEIVSMLNNPINADLPRATHVDSKEWNNLINDDEKNYQEIKNNLNKVVTSDHFWNIDKSLKYSEEMSVKDILIHKNIIYVSYSREVTEECFNTSIVKANFNYNFLNFLIYISLRWLKLSACQIFHIFL